MSIEGKLDERDNEDETMTWSEQPIMTALPREPSELLPDRLPWPTAALVIGSLAAASWLVVGMSLSWLLG